MLCQDVPPRMMGATMSEGKRTKIVCTLGPATESDDTLRQMIEAGMNVARLNFSHGDHDYHRSNIERVRRVADELGVRVAIMVDTKGPEIRTRLNEDARPVELCTGETVRITARPIASTQGRIAIDYERIADEVVPGNTIFIDDGLIALRVEDIVGDELECRIINGGLVGEHKGVNIPNVAVGLPNVTERDHDDIRFSCEMGVDAIAASFVRGPEAVQEIRELCKAYGAKDMMIVSKIESAQAIKHLDDIILASDAIMVARGDLGVEIPPADIPLVQKDIIRRCNLRQRPVITATQMLESMTHSPRPTRAEVTDVANAILDGTDCVMLSGETAAGQWPVEAVKMMAELCRKTEESLPERSDYFEPGAANSTSTAAGFAAVSMARLVRAKALVCPTLSGRTARIVSEYRPRLPIYATSPLEPILRRCCFYWGVEAVPSPEEESVTQTCYGALKSVRAQGLLGQDDTVIITAGDPLTSPLESDGPSSETSTNVLMIAQAM
jgi:pyruvate kinase